MNDEREELRRLRRLRELEAKAGAARSPEMTPEQRGEFFSQTVHNLIDDVPPLGRAARAMGGLRGPNWSGEVYGAAAEAAGALTGRPTSGRAAARVEQELVDRERQERPVTTFAEDLIAGTGATLLGGAGLAANAPRVAQAGANFARARPAASAALSGLAGGAVAGAGAGETGADRRFGALAGGAAGAALAPLIPAAAPLIGRGANAVARRMGREADNVPEGVRKFLASVPEEAQRETAENIGEAGPEFLGERLGARGERIMTDLAQGDDAAANLARAAARRRAEQRTGRVMAEVQMRTGSRRGVDAIADRAAAQQQAAPMFQAAAARPVNVSGQMRAALREADRLGIDVRSADTPGELSLAAMLDDQTQEGAVSFGRLHQLVQDIEDEASSLFRNGRGNRGERVSALARDMRSQLREASPEFAEASRIWRSSKNDERAFQIGTRVFDEGRDRASIEYELRNFVGNMDDLSASERGQFLSGVLDAIERRASSTGQGGNAGSRLTRQGVRERLSLVFGEDEAESLSQMLTREGYTASLDRMYDPNMGSNTAGRQASAGAADEALRGGGSRFAADVVQDVRGGTIGKGRAAIANSIRRAPERERQMLAELMFMESSPDANAMLERMISEQRRRAGLIGGAAAYGGYGAGTATQRD